MSNGTRTPTFGGYTFAAACALACSLGIVLTAHAHQSAQPEHSTFAVEDLIQFQQRPDDASILRTFEVTANRIGPTGNVRFSELEPRSDTAMGPAVLIRDRFSGSVRQLTVTQKATIDDAHCLKLAEVSHALGLFVQPPEPTPVWKTDGQRKHAFHENSQVSIDAIGRSPGSDCLGSVVFKYKN
ncbi:TPA: hypothetical protein ACG4NT_001059 [Stenotrophomonas maltophilia]